MKRQTAKVHKPRGHPVARRHRKVHHSFSLVIMVVWLAIIGCTGLVSYRYFKDHHSISISRSGVTVLVTKVEYNDLGTPPFGAPHGWKFIVVDTTVTNHRTTVFDFAPVLQTHITDAHGTRYDMTPILLQNPIAAGPMQPGTSLEGSLSYLVPINASGLVFDFKP